MDVKLTRSDTSITKTRVQLLVEALTWGAARFGVGALFGDVVSRGYEARTFAGSSQQEIALASNPRLGWEAVVGFAPYVLDMWKCPGHGRSHTGGCNMRFSPFFGIGLIGQAPAGTSSFNSLYVGAELEFASSFSLAATAVWRQVQTLAPGYVLGSPVTPDTKFTQTATAVGFGLVLNATPDFLQFGKAAPANPPPSPPTDTGGNSGGAGSGGSSPGGAPGGGTAGSAGTPMGGTSGSGRGVS